MGLESAMLNFKSFKGKYRRYLGKSQDPNVPTHNGSTPLLSSSTTTSPEPLPGNHSLHQTSNTQLPPIPQVFVLRSDNLWLEAHDKLSADDRVIVERFIPHEGPLKFNANDMGHALKEKGEECKSQNWKFRVGKHAVSLQNAVDKTLYWLEKVKGPIDVAVSADPLHAALPWAGIKFLILIVEANRNQIESLLSGISHIFCVTRRCQLYEALMNDDSLPKDGHSMRARQNLRSALIEFYVVILHFLARAARTYQHSSSRRAITAIWSSGDIGDFERQCQKFERRAETEAQVFERCQSNHARKVLSEIKCQIDDIGHVEITTSATWEYLQGEERHKILKWVTEIDAEDQHQTAKDDRTVGTGNWLLAHAEFQNWQSLDESAILWLHGIPGAGKTKLVSKVIDHFENQPDITLAYFYCDREDEKRRDPVNILRSYIKQLSDSPQKDAIRHPIVERYRKVHYSGSSTKLNFRECEAVLPELINSSLNPILILDALDEAVVGPREKLLNSLDLLLSNCHNLKIFISSRRDEDIKRRLQKKTNLGIEANDNQGDIEKFIDAELQKMATSSHPDLSQDLRVQIVENLLQRNEGMFQWVALLIRTLPQIPEDIPDWLKRLPRDLPDAYGRIFAEIQALDGSKPKLALRAFEWVIHSFEPLQPNALVEFVRQTPDGNGVEYSTLKIEGILDACRNLLVIDTYSKVCRFPHLSVREFLEDHIYGNKELVIDRHFHNRLAVVSLGFLFDTLCRFTTSRKQEDVPSWYLKILYPYGSPAHYAARFWPWHAKIALAARNDSMNKNSERLVILIERLFSLQFDFAYNVWLSIHDCRFDCSPLNFRGLDRPGKLYYASVLDFDFLVKKFTSDRTKADLADDIYGIGFPDRNAIEAAGVMSSPKSLRLLLRTIGTIRIEDIYVFMRKIENNFQETLSLLEEFPVQFSDQEPPSSETVSSVAGPHFADNLLTGMVVNAAKNLKAGDQLLRVLLDRYPSISITEEVLEATAFNESVGDKAMLMLFDTYKPGVSITESVIQSAARNTACADKVMAILLERSEPMISITENVIECAATNEGCGDKVMAVLLKKSKPTISITEDFVQSAAKNEGCGDKVMAILLEISEPTIPITEQVMQSAAANTRCGVKVMATILEMSEPRITSITDKVMQIAAANERCGEELVAMLLGNSELEIPITENVMKAAATNGSCGVEVMTTLLEMSDSRISITETVLHSAAQNHFHGDKLMVMLLTRSAHQIPITETVLQLAAGNDLSQTMAMLLERSDQRHITKTVIQRAAANQGCGHILMEMLLDKYSSTRPDRRDAFFDREVIDSIFSNFGSGHRIMTVLLKKERANVFVNNRRMESCLWSPMMESLFQLQPQVLVSIDLLEEVAKGLNIIRYLFHRQATEATAEDALKLAAVNSFDADPISISASLEGREAALQIPEDLITIVAGNSPSEGITHKPLPMDSIPGFSVSDEVTLFAIQCGDRGWRLWEMLLTMRAYSKAIRDICADIDGVGTYKTYKEDVWDHLRPQRREEIIECLIEGQFSVPITEDLRQMLDSLPDGDDILSKFSELTSHATESDVLGRFTRSMAYPEKAGSDQDEIADDSPKSTD
ncbi:unnamed protein product [Penicillium glandicola]